MRIVNRAGLSPAQLASVGRELAGQQNLNDVLKWARRAPPGTFIPSVVADVIVQDEFTHDVIVPWRDPLVLVYAAT